MPITRLLLLRQRRHGGHKDKDGPPGSPHGSPNSPMSPGGSDCHGNGQRFFGNNMPKKRLQNGAAGDHYNSGTKLAGKHKLTKSDEKHLFSRPRLVVAIISCIIVLFSFILYDLDMYLFLKSRIKSFQSNNGGWRLADDQTNRKYDTSVCDIDRKWSHELTSEDFELFYRYKKPVIVQFSNGAIDWTDPAKWAVWNLKREYGDWTVMSGNSREIVRRGGTGDIETSFSDFLDEMLNRNDSLEEPQYLFDRHFYSDTELPSSLHLPDYFEVQEDLHDTLFFLGSSSSGVSFHKHADAWNGVVYGRKRWFLYPIEKTPPGGVYPGFTTVEWFDQLLPHLPPEDLPLQCIQEPGEILYLPEGMYHATINLGDTIAVGVQRKLATTTAEILFYEENAIAKKLGKELNSEQMSSLLNRKKQIFERLLEMLPDNSEVQMKAGRMYKEHGDQNKALEHTERALMLDKYFIVAMLNQADSLTKLGYADKAEHLYKRALDLNPRLWDVYAYYGDFLLNHNRPEEAASMFQQGTELQPNSVNFWTRLKLALERSGNIKGAEDIQRKINEISKPKR